jgi:hypothetical protein
MGAAAMKIRLEDTVTDIRDSMLPRLMVTPVGAMRFLEGEAMAYL